MNLWRFGEIKSEIARGFFVAKITIQFTLQTCCRSGRIVELHCENK